MTLVLYACQTPFASGHRWALSHISGFSLSLPTLGKVIAETFQKIGLSDSSKVKLTSRAESMTSAQNGERDLSETARKVRTHLDLRKPEDYT